MKVKRNNGYVSAITFINYLDTEKTSRLRDFIFNSASTACGFEPKYRLDIYDETILIFESSFSSINFLISLFRASINEDNSTHSLKFKSGLCSGDFFIHQDQIYGEAVNFATQLSYSSQQNEILVCGIDQNSAEEFTDNQSDVFIAARNQQDNSFSISIIDGDLTLATINNQTFQVKYNNQVQEITLSPIRKISIGRSNKADIFIDDDNISRNHATITIKDEKVFIEDHSSNGTYVYSDDHERYITNDSVTLSDKGYILCGKTQIGNGNPAEINNIISFQLTR